MSLIYDRSIRFPTTSMENASTTSPTQIQPSLPPTTTTLARSSREASPAFLQACHHPIPFTLSHPVHHSHPIQNPIPADHRPLLGKPHSASIRAASTRARPTSQPSTPSHQSTHSLDSSSSQTHHSCLTNLTSSASPSRSPSSLSPHLSFKSSSSSPTSAIRPLSSYSLPASPPPRSPSCPPYHLPPIANLAPPYNHLRLAFPRPPLPSLSSSSSHPVSVPSTSANLSHEIKRSIRRFSAIIPSLSSRALSLHDRQHPTIHSSKSLRTVSRLMNHHQSQPTPNPLTKSFRSKRSPANPQGPSKPSLKTSRPIGGIGESPLQPNSYSNSNSTAHVPSTAIVNPHLPLTSRLLPPFHKPSSHHPRPITPTSHATSSTIPEYHHYTLSSASNPGHAVPSEISFPSMERPATIESNSTSQSNQHRPSSSKHSQGILTLDPESRFPPLFGQTPIRRDAKSTSSAHSLVTSLALAPISSSCLPPQNLPLNFEPLPLPSADSFNPSILLSGPPPPTLSEEHSREVLSSSVAPQHPTIPSLLNPSRVKYLPADPPSPSPRLASVKTDDDIAKISNLSSHSTHQHLPSSLDHLHPSDLFQPHNPPLSSNPAINPQPQPSLQPHTAVVHPNPHDVGSIQDPSVHPRAPTQWPLSNVTFKVKPIDRSRRFGVTFEPSGAPLCKYVLPKPRLDPSPSRHPRDLQHGRPSKDSNLVTAVNPFTNRPLPRDSDALLEELNERYWTSKNNNLDVQHIWAEIYVSNLERKLWRSEAEVDVSINDCLALCCLPLTNHPKLLARTRPRVNSAPTGVSPLDPRHPPGTQNPFNNDKPMITPIGLPKSQRAPFYKAFSSTVRLRRNPSKLRPASPLEISDGPLPCISFGSSSASKAITPYISDPSSPIHHRLDPSSRSIVSSHALSRLERPSNLPSNGPERRYRIVLSDTPTPRVSGNSSRENPRSLRRKSRSVPNLQRERLASSQLNSLISTLSNEPAELSKSVDHQIIQPTTESKLSDADPTPSIPPLPVVIPQSLLDAIFLPVSVLNRNSSPYSSENLSSVPARSGCLHPAPHARDHCLSEYGTIEIGENRSSGSQSDSPPAPPVESPEPLSKGPLHSLPRFIEPRSTSIVALPPPPRKRNPTAGTSVHSSIHSSASASKATSSEVEQSTNESLPLPSIARSSAESSFKRVVRHHPSLTAPRNHQTLSTPHTPSKHIVSRSSDDLAFLSPLILSNNPSSTYNTPQRSRRQTVSCFYPVSPHSHRFSELLLPSSRCSHDKSGAPSESDGRSGPINLGPGVLISQSNQGETHTCSPSGSITTTKDRVSKDVKRAKSAETVQTDLSSLLNGSISINSIIDPDRHIDQSDLFYQLPSSPQQDLIQDYTEKVLKSRKLFEIHTGLTPPSAMNTKHSALVDEVLAGAADRRRSISRDRSSGSSQSRESAVDPSNRLSQYSIVCRVPSIVDAFEARRASNPQTYTAEVAMKLGKPVENRSTVDLPDNAGRKRGPLAATSNVPQDLGVRIDEGGSLNSIRYSIDENS